MKKNGILMFCILMLSVGSILLCSSSPADKYTYGKRTAVTVALTDTVNLELAPNNISQMLVTATIDTNVVVTADDANSIANDILVVKLTASGGNRQVDWSTNIIAVDDSVVSTKTKVFTFIYDGSNFIQTSEIQINQGLGFSHMNLQLLDFPAALYGVAVFPYTIRHKYQDTGHKMVNSEVFELLIADTLKAIGAYSQPAVELLLGTRAQESAGGTYRRQLGNGPALGVFQMEPDTHDDCWENYLRYRPDLGGKIMMVSGVFEPNASHLEFNDKYAICMARVKYMRDPMPIPADLIGQAATWKRVYNTHLGKGTIEEYIRNYNTYVG